MIDKFVLLKLILGEYKEDKKYVFLEKDSTGYFIQYVFSDEDVPYKRCLSWYIIGDEIEKKPMIRKINHIYEISELTCNGVCKIGNPKCNEIKDNWSINRPMKCACYTFEREISIEDLYKIYKIDELIKVINKL